MIVDSIINRTPTYLLEEIILIDDCSTENYSSMLEVLPKVKLYRNEIREGLIRSRNRAAKLSVGEFLFFLDSHCEVRSCKYFEHICLMNMLIVGKHIMVRTVTTGSNLKSRSSC